MRFRGANGLSKEHDGSRDQQPVRRMTPGHRNIQQHGPQGVFETKTQRRSQVKQEIKVPTR
jgi:hypothetical protein